MKKFISYSIPIITLAVFVFLMLGGNYFKRPHNPSEDVVALVQLSITHAQVEKWNMLKQDVDSIDFA